jgi:uncharacterized membrane protein YeiB
MAAPKNASLAPFLTLTKGMQVRIHALDPVSGAAVAGVVVSNVALSVDQEDAGDNALPVTVSPAYLQGSEQLA